MTDAIQIFLCLLLLQIPLSFLYFWIYLLYFFCTWKGTRIWVKLGYISVALYNSFHGNNKQNCYWTFICYEDYYRHFHLNIIYIWIIIHTISELIKFNQQKLQNWVFVFCFFFFCCHLSGKGDILMKRNCVFIPLHIPNIIFFF